MCQFDNNISLYCSSRTWPWAKELFGSLKAQQAFEKYDETFIWKKIEERYK
jgi:hypothetical protein